MTWTLIVLLLAWSPPIQGIYIVGYATEADCKKAAAEYCDGLPQFKCVCRQIEQDQMS